MDDEYLRKHPWVVVERFLHERYGDCQEEETASELELLLATYGHKFVSSSSRVDITEK